MNIRNILKRIYHGLHLEKPYAFLYLLFTPYGFIRNSLWFPISAFLRSHGYRTENENRLLSLKGKFEGKRAFIIATGPSLQLEDVNLLADEYTIGVNSIFKLYDKMGWTPSFYMCLDKMSYEKFVQFEDYNLDKCAKLNCFINSLCSDNRNSLKTIKLHTCWLDHIWNFGSRKFKYNSELTYGIYDFYSVTHSAILLCIYLGFKEVYFTGVDNNYMGSQTHFEESKGDDNYDYKEALRTQQAMDAGYEEVFKIAEKINVKIYNATRGGCVKPFPRVNLQDLFANSKIE